MLAAPVLSRVKTLYLHDLETSMADVLDVVNASLAADKLENLTLKYWRAPTSYSRFPSPTCAWFFPDLKTLTVGVEMAEWSPNCQLFGHGPADSWS